MNNNQTSNTTCTATFQAASCYVNRSGANNWSARYYCSNGTGTMDKCYYNGTECDGGFNGSTYKFYGCVQPNGGSVYNDGYNPCKNSLYNVVNSGGSLNSSINCSC